MPAFDDDPEARTRLGSEDLIGSDPDRLDSFLGRLKSRFPRTLGRPAVLTVAAVAAVAAAVSLVTGQVTAQAPTTEPVAVAPAPTSTATTQSPDARLALLTIGQLATIGEIASGGTYTRGSASAIPNPCLQPHAGDTGVSYVPGAAGATAVSFQLAGSSITSVTQRVTRLADDLAAAMRLREVVDAQRDCQLGAGLSVVVGDIGPGLGDELASVSIGRGYPSGAASTTEILLVRLGASLVEFSLTGPSADRAGDAARCFAIAQAGLTR